MDDDPALNGDRPQGYPLSRQEDPARARSARPPRRDSPWMADDGAAACHARGPQGSRVIMAERLPTGELVMMTEDVLKQHVQLDRARDIALDDVRRLIREPDGIYEDAGRRKTPAGGILWSGSRPIRMGR
jgi:hypothetical protein